jgi:hypothetical protein
MIGWLAKVTWAPSRGKSRRNQAHQSDPAARQNQGHARMTAGCWRASRRVNALSISQPAAANCGKVGK